MQAIPTGLGLFDGDPGFMTLTYDVVHLSKFRYRLAGQILRWSLALGGPGLPIFHPTVYDLMFRRAPVITLTDPLHLPGMLEERVQEVNNFKLKLPIFILMSFRLLLMTTICSSYLSSTLAITYLEYYILRMVIRSTKNVFQFRYDYCHKNNISC